MATFRGLVGSIESSLADWEAWFRDPTPETADLPGEWESKCSDLQRMVLVRCLRPDRVLFSASAFVSNNLGRKYVEPPVLDLAEVFRDSNPMAPLIFVLSPGVDPTDALKKLAVEKGMGDRVLSVALGQVRTQLGAIHNNSVVPHGPISELRFGTYQLWYCSAWLCNRVHQPAPCRICSREALWTNG